VNRDTGKEEKLRGEHISSVEQVVVKETLKIRLADGTLASEVTDIQRDIEHE